MADLRFTLLADGPFDRALLHHLAWILRSRLGDGMALQQQWADFRALRTKPSTLSERIRVAIALYPCDLLFVHRDAEGADPRIRIEEIAEAAGIAGTSIPFVPVVPVRMTEAWLLFDEHAVRLAAGNPNGRAPLELPVRSPEEMHDPKSFLHGVLRTACGLKGRRLRDFSTSQAAHRIAEYIDDFSPLRALSAFAALELRIANVINRCSR